MKPKAVAKKKTQAKKPPPRKKTPAPIEGTKKRGRPKKSPADNTKEAEAEEVAPTEQTDKVQVRVLDPKFHIRRDTSKGDQVLLCEVAFDLEDGDVGSRIAEHFGGMQKIIGSTTKVHNNTILFGHIAKVKAKSLQGTVTYEVN